MALPKIEDARSLSDAELEQEILAAKRQLFDLRLQKATKRLEKPHQFKHLKHRIAQLMTVERERQLAQKESTDTSQSDTPQSEESDTPQSESDE
ncbi:MULTISPECIES: 50S ribosomal protein L29 [unclassified Moorena]|uniref:50S ribosomal protein L29 n=1 Tax=unclassified Moorena TaxID=2683338 RepID=UPI0013C6A166|nr:MULTISPECIES: 50S ribosomal protein L29 [unclassified Moorena]NEO22620.1 50S ribosomal protein L29 [Moorena sp. SIO4A5]NEP22842.1 50S ribosomal protein L29 [Moorena sp. SIO3I6]NEQ60300.1 50S ribosomal protein L29 [Moorena sp. SIO4A1]